MVWSRKSFVFFGTSSLTLCAAGGPPTVDDFWSNCAVRFNIFTINPPPARIIINHHLNQSSSTHQCWNLHELLQNHQQALKSTWLSTSAQKNTKLVICMSFNKIKSIVLTIFMIYVMHNCLLDVIASFSGLILFVFDILKNSVCDIIFCHVWFCYHCHHSRHMLWFTDFWPCIE